VEVGGLEGVGLASGVARSWQADSPTTRRTQNKRITNCLFISLKILPENRLFFMSKNFNQPQGILRIDCKAVWIRYPILTLFTETFILVDRYIK